MNKWVREKDNIEKAINEGISYEELGRKYDCSGTYIKRIATRLGIMLTPRRAINPNETFNRGKILVKTSTCRNCGKEFPIYPSSSNQYCSHKCEHDYKHKEGYLKLLNGDPSIMRANYNPGKAFKKDILEEQNNRCSICGCEQVHNGKLLVFILDHIDGNAANNKRDNLRCICPNCDSQLDTYKSKNKNGARSYYRYHRWKNK